MSDVDFFEEPDSLQTVSCVGSKTDKKIAQMRHDIFTFFYFALCRKNKNALHSRFLQSRPMDSIGGHVSASKDKEGRSEVTVEGHITSRSNDGKTSVSAAGQVSMTDQGRVSGEVNVKVEHEF